MFRYPKMVIRITVLLLFVFPLAPKVLQADELFIMLSDSDDDLNICHVIIPKVNPAPVTDLLRPLIDREQIDLYGLVFFHSYSTEIRRMRLELTEILQQVYNPYFY